MGARLARDTASARKPPSVPTTGMRGGLGRTLLTAFLILTIVPLAVIGAYAAQQNRRNVEAEVASRLLAIAALKGEALRRWSEGLQVALLSSPLLQGDYPPATYEAWWTMLKDHTAGSLGVMLLEGPAQADGWQPIWSAGECGSTAARLPDSLLAALVTDTGGSRSALVFVEATEGQDDDHEELLAAVVAARPELAASTDSGEGTGRAAVLCVGWTAIAEVLSETQDVKASSDMPSYGDSTGAVSLLYRSRAWPSGETRTLMASAEGSTEPHYEHYQSQSGQEVIGAYYPLPDLEAGILVEQAKSDMLVSTERIVATLIALVLAVALATTAIAAVVIRQITRPVIDLTESAVAMAEGDLDQHLAVRSRDEIGILTYVFNEMASELKVLYSDLEAKVVERTKRLQQANYQIQRRALHLQASQEVSQAITSIRDPELLLMQVTELIRNHFVYSSVAVYLVAPGGGVARLQASSPPVPSAPPEDDAKDAIETGVQDVDGARDHRGHGPWPATFRAGDGSVVGRALRNGQAQVHTEELPRSEFGSDEYGWYARVASQVAVPLKMEDRVVGVVVVSTTAHEGVQQDEVEVLEALANQVTIALENARAYERERMAMEHLEMAEAFKARFLTNMSRELMGPLNTIIGFSRLLIKGIDGSLTQQQQEDLSQIHESSRRLHALIKDMLAISEIQAGLMELRVQPVDLPALIDEIMPTASALVRGKPVELIRDVPQELPRLAADPARLRQILIRLLNNAAKFTEEGQIGIRAWANDGEVFVTVSDTGVGIPMVDRERIFTHFGNGGMYRSATVSAAEPLSVASTEQRNGGRDQRGVGLGLALCKEFVELHGGQIWVDSEVGKGSLFTFSVPVYENGGEHPDST
ncbi:MAG: ATP-binding protein [Anaerolineae bacterium]